VRKRISWLLILASAAVARGTAAEPPAGSFVVSWSEKCPSATYISVVLSVDGRSAYSRNIPVCFTERNSLPPATLSTTLQTDRSHFGEPSRTPLEVDFWEASADPDALVLGISFSSKQRVWLNTLHVALSSKQAVTELAPGVSVRTFPTVSKEPPNTSLERTRGR
jgi:hypothetical protein